MNIQQNVECGCRWIIASPFGNFHSARGSPQKALLGLANIQESYVNTIGNEEEDPKKTDLRPKLIVKETEIN
jgi:hypothetical protein